MACVGNDNDLRAVTHRRRRRLRRHEEGRDLRRPHHRLRRGRARARRRRRPRRGFNFIDAPVSGGQAGAENGVLTVMCGGDADAYAERRAGDRGLCPDVQAARARPAPASSPRWSTRSASPDWSQGLSEGIHFAKKAGLDVEAVIDTISKGAAQSWQMENRYKTMNDGKFDFGFAVEWMRKDLSICLAEARRNGASLPVTALVDQFYAEVEKMGGKRWDTSSLLARLER